jgi:formylglycine-generating enzyme required for sulfatase activity
LLPHYGWYFGNSPEQTQPVGTKKPNDWGLFDVHGNVWNWCQERYKLYATAKQGTALEDIEDGVSILSTNRHVLRGGSFDFRAVFVRSADRSWNVPTYRSQGIGLRPARTFAP